MASQFWLQALHSLRLLPLCASPQSGDAMLGFERPADRCWSASSWCPLIELDVRGAYARIVLTSTPARWRRASEAGEAEEPLFRRWPRRFAAQQLVDGADNKHKNSWNWSLIFAEQSHEAARARCMLWWRVLHDRWQSPMLRRRWQPEGSGWCSVCAARADRMLALGTTAHVFIECDEAQRVWHWLRDVWRALTDGGAAL